ncbi:glycoside hydrolase family 10 protein [Phialemonium atrogriseum]|uniref:Beta-xylanase n=1 Tax=Phialemonium atrogriseum TaxID=1093897 RepID=A0AAJ0C8R2_9PEZI|nr:glycoside hydrolase family 10 protein [Phialemonium atrogriseum]KAK1770734.1 glycoside hydrolase family 10 protein [Phialemonium atrogriseum]
MGFKDSLIAVLLVSAGVGVAAQKQNQTQGLHSLFVASGKLFFGTATDTNLFKDVEYLKIANNSNEFGIRVPENSQKWQPTEPKEGTFDFANSDMVALTSRQNGQMLRCHTLTWHSQLPAFVQTNVWTRKTLVAAIQTHIANVVGHFKGQCYSWDVVNEALNENGTFRNDVFFQTLGTEYIPISFAAAAEADPDAKLYYNDFNLETTEAKADAAVAIVRLLQAADVRIDGLGFQAHMDVGRTPNQTALAATLNRFTALGLEVAYTELDIRHAKLPPNATDLQQQAKDYVSVVGSCLAVAKCVGIVVWEFTDKYSWIPSTFPGKGDACLFDANFTKKPAYTAVFNLLTAAAATAPPTGGVNGNGTRFGAFGASAGSASTMTTVPTGGPQVAAKSQGSAPLGITGQLGSLLSFALFGVFVFIL